MEPFKNLLEHEAANTIAFAVRRSYPTFDSKAFLKNIKNSLEPLELKERSLFLKNRLIETLPTSQEKSFDILIGALKQSETDSVGLSGFKVWPLTQFVADKGINHFDLSMNALKHMTKVFTAEFAVRTFFLVHEDKTLKQFKNWIEDENEHVRRLVSEGSRPLLPWAQKLPSFIKDPDKTWPLLEKLKLDPSKYVQKSVANHINDHSKNHSDFVVRQLLKWNKIKHPEGVDWIIRHATRTLVKRCHPGALKLHGISSDIIKITNTKLLTPKVKLGESLRVSLTIFNPQKSQTVVIADHELKLLKANGKHAPKVFKGKKLKLESLEEKTLEFRIPIKQITTRVYYPGDQFWTPIVNGKSGSSFKFTLKT